MAEDPRTMRPAPAPAGGPVAPPPRVTYRILTEALQNLTAEDGSPLRRE